MAKKKKKKAKRERRERGGKNRRKDEGSIYEEHQSPAAGGKPVGETEMCNHFRISQNFSQPGFSNLIRTRRRGVARPA